MRPWLRVLQHDTPLESGCHRGEVEGFVATEMSGAIKSRET
jgi:hypothetical protein